MVRENVTVSGTLEVRHTRTVAPPGTLPERSPLSRVRVRVRGKRRTGLWRDLGETSTDFAGRFSVTSDERAGDWRFRVDVRLKADDLVVRGHTHADWDTVLEQPQQRGEDLTGAVLVFGDRVASDRDATARLDELSADHDRAEVWVIARRMLDTLDDLGSPFATGLIRPYTLEVVTPSLGVYASPITRNAHVPGRASVETILHECMHVWAYDHTRPLTGGQAVLIPSAIGGGTHEVEEFASTAFHEGFAEFAAERLEQIMFGAPVPLPGNRARHARNGQRTVADLVRNEDTWESILNTLVTPQLHRFRFGTAADTPGVITEDPDPPTGCVSPSTTFAGILSVFGTNAARGIDKRLSRAEMRDLRTYLDRVVTMVGGTMIGHAGDLLRLLDPADTVEPRELFCS